MSYYDSLKHAKLVFFKWFRNQLQNTTFACYVCILLFTDDGINHKEK